MTKYNKVKRMNGSTGSAKRQAKPKEQAKKSIVPCQQKMCDLKDKGCPQCSECGAMPNMISEGCKTCFDCEFKEGAIRDGRDNKNQVEVFNKFKELFGGKVRVEKIPEKKLKRLLTANGEVLDEEELDNSQEPSQRNQDNNQMLGGVDFEKQLKAEIIRQMASKVLANAEETARKMNDMNANINIKGKGKGDKHKSKHKDKFEEPEELEEEPKRYSPYIGYVC